MESRTRRRVAAVAMSAGLAAAVTAPANATASPSPDLGPADGQLANAQMLEALERDLDLAPDEAREVLADELAAAQTEADLRADLGDAFGGAWVESGALTVAITDPSVADEVRAAGAEATVVPHSEQELDSMVSALNDVPAPDADEVYGWRVDVPGNRVVVSAAPGAVDAATEWLETAGVETATVQVETDTGAPEPLYDIIGGDAYYPGNARCSVGFSVSSGFVTAGHCGGTGTSVSGYNQVSMGTVQDSNFPGRDMGYVATNSSWTPRALVAQSSGTIAVNGSQEASIGAATCRSGSTTGYQCGEITAKNQTVNYSQGSVYGLTRTSACAEGGDSGGSFIAAGIHAQGVTSGGSGNCYWGGTTFFQPVNPILNAYNLSLVTS